MLTCSMMRFLSLLLLGMCLCVVSVVVFGLSVRLSWYPMWMRWLSVTDVCTVVCVAYVYAESVRVTEMLVWGM